MTFIVAIQLADSIIVAADNRITIEKNDADKTSRKSSIVKKSYSDTLQKIRFWQHGMISGTGESLTLERIFRIFQQDNEPGQLPALLHESCRQRQQEIGTHAQLEKTRLLYSCPTPTGIRLKIIGRYDNNIKDNQVKPMTIELFVFNDDISPIYHNLIDLQQSLRNPEQFVSIPDWISYYLPPLRKIFYKFSQTDHTVSPSFDVYFQTPQQQFLKHMQASC
jgi:hypothetical protein